MFWKTLHLTVNLTFLLLAAVIMVTLLKNDGYSEDLATYKTVAEDLKREVMTTNQNNFSYLENKLNTVSSGQDSYQLGVDRRLDILEARVRLLENKNKEASRIINTNTALYNNYTKQ